MVNLCFQKGRLSMIERALSTKFAGFRLWKPNLPFPAWGSCRNTPGFIEQKDKSTMMKFFDVEQRNSLVFSVLLYLIVSRFSLRTAKLAFNRILPRI